MQEERTVATNIGNIPYADYLDIIAQQCGFGNYDDMHAAGYFTKDEEEN